MTSYFLRQKVFQLVLENKGQVPAELAVQADLKAPANPELSVLKEAVIKAQNLYLMQRRVCDLLSRQLDFIAENTSLYLEGIAVISHEQNAFHDDLKGILKLLRSQPGEIFTSDYNYRADAEEMLSKFCKKLEDLIAEHLNSVLLREIVKSEIKLAQRFILSVKRRSIESHRLRGLAPDESSYEAFRKAFKENLLGIEFDIRCSKDKVPIVHHNNSLGASAKRTESIYELSADEISKVKLKGGGHIPSLEEVFELVKSQHNETTFLRIDVKDFDEEMLEALLSLIAKYQLQHRVSFLSWFPQVLQYLYEKYPFARYSLSYYPVIRPVGKLGLGILNRALKGQITGGLLFGKLSLWYNEKRNQALKQGHDKIKKTSGEIIADTYLFTKDIHWTEVRDQAKKQNKPLVGMHAMAVGGAPVEGKRHMHLMAQVLRYGSVDVMALEEVLYAIVDSLPLVKIFKHHIINIFGRLYKLQHFARECASNEIKVNIFDLKRKSTIDCYFDNMEKAKIQVGTVYSSNPKSVPIFNLQKAFTYADRKQMLKNLDQK